MNVKIMSMQRVINYGSFMQAFALKRTIEGMGHSVSFLDFQVGEPRHKGEKVRAPNIFDKLNKLPTVVFRPNSVLGRRHFRRNLEESFRVRGWPALGLGEEMDTDSEADVVVIGSDEVFNYTQNHGFGYVRQLFGHDLICKRIISYAASAGYADVQDVESDGLADELRAGFLKFDAISVRDGNTYDLVSKYSTKAIEMVLDPTLIYDFDEEAGRGPELQDSLLVYAYEGRLDDPEEVALVRSFAHSRGLRIVSVGFYHDWCDLNLVVDPIQLLSVFSSAECVITDTFHGTIFSIKNRKPFLTLLRKTSRWGSNFNKVSFLLQQLGLESRINYDLRNLSDQMGVAVDYGLVEQRMEPMRTRSLRFLRSNLVVS